MRIIVDAMGGDNAPKAPVLGAIEAAKSEGIKNIYSMVEGAGDVFIHNTLKCL